MLDREGWAGPEDAALIGTEAEVAERIEKLREAGVDEFVGPRSVPASSVPAAEPCC